MRALLLALLASAAGVGESHGQPAAAAAAADLERVSLQQSLPAAIEEIKGSLGLDMSLKGNKALRAAREELGMLPPAPGTSMRVNVRQVAAELGVHVDAATDADALASTSATATVAAAGPVPSAAEVFGALDSDQDGRLTTDELTSWFSEAQRLGRQVGEDAGGAAQLGSLEEDFALFDLNADGRVSRQEFLGHAATLSSEALTAQIVSLKSREAEAQIVIHSKTSTTKVAEHAALAAELSKNITRLQAVVDARALSLHTDMQHFARSDQDHDDLLTPEEYGASKHRYTTKPLELIEARIQHGAAELQHKLDENADGYTSGAEMDAAHAWFVHLSHPSYLNKEL